VLRRICVLISRIGSPAAIGSNDVTFQNQLLPASGDESIARACVPE